MKTNLKEIIGLCLYLAIILGVTYLLVHFVAQRTEVKGDSMEYTLYSGDQVVVDKLTYRFHEPERYDIIAFPYRYELDTYYVKRIIGMPGEKVRIDGQGTIFINDEALDEPVDYETMVQPGIAFTPRTLGEDEYFVLGDNRNNSTDSRSADVGLIRRSEIIGRVWLRTYPFSRFGRID